MAAMNPRLATLHAYPFEKLSGLMAGALPAADLRPISLSIGEPRHTTPPFIKEAMGASLDGLASYPATRGAPLLRAAISAWLARRYGIPGPDPEQQVLPVLGTREALFAFAQTVIDPQAGSVVLCPNPFYQIYEGAALLAGGRPVYVNADAARNFGCDWEGVPAATWRDTALVYVCSPGNPAGNVMDLETWRTLFAKSDQYGFVIAADECYSEIYFDDDAPPLGALQAARMLGRDDYRNLMVFSSLSKRSNVPGLRSGFVAGDAAIIKRFLLYRTYHGSAMSNVVAQASIAAWNDEAHVRDNRRQYREKFAAVLPILGAVLDTPRPDASFYLWVRTPGSDTTFVRGLYEQQGVSVLPGSYLAREADGRNPGANRIRIALVAPLDDCIEGARRIAQYARDTAGALI